MTITFKVRRAFETHELKRANQLIDGGWQLIEVLQHRYGEDAGPIYILGWDAEKGEPVIPPHPDDSKISHF